MELLSCALLGRSTGMQENITGQMALSDIRVLDLSRIYGARPLLKRQMGSELKLHILPAATEINVQLRLTLNSRQILKN